MTTPLQNVGTAESVLAEDQLTMQNAYNALVAAKDAYNAYMNSTYGPAFNAWNTAQNAANIAVRTDLFDNQQTSLSLTTEALISVALQKVPPVTSSIGQMTTLAGNYTAAMNSYNAAVDAYQADRAALNTAVVALGATQLGVGDISAVQGAYAISPSPQVPGAGSEPGTNGAVGTKWSFRTDYPFPE
ncbi:MAG TPA: hypothetical protein VNM37_07385 [Candidatus Dormibacteraeota bacterium]|nr:hypothetical protein [Candidatus Dormibacteraeota bacterium]